METKQRNFSSPRVFSSSALYINKHFMCINGNYNIFESTTEMETETNFSNVCTEVDKNFTWKIINSLDFIDANTSISAWFGFHNFSSVAHSNGNNKTKSSVKPWVLVKNHLMKHYVKWKKEKILRQTIAWALSFLTLDFAPY